jgi:hypothetical protein
MKSRSVIRLKITISQNYSRVNIMNIIYLMRYIYDCVWLAKICKPRNIRHGN